MIISARIQADDTITHSIILTNSKRLAHMDDDAIAAICLEFGYYLCKIREELREQNDGH